MGVSYWGKLELRFVEPKAKINANYYVEHLLTPLFENDILRMFLGRRVNAPAHSAKATQKWLKYSGIDFVPKEHWMGNSPDCALMDFCVNGLFKWALFD